MGVEYVLSQSEILMTMQRLTTERSVSREFLMFKMCLVLLLSWCVQCSRLSMSSLKKLMHEFYYGGRLARAPAERIPCRRLDKADISVPKFSVPQYWLHVVFHEIIFKNPPSLDHLNGNSK